MRDLTLFDEPLTVKCCSFCGAQPHLVYQGRGAFGNECSVRCMKCGAMGAYDPIARHDAQFSRAVELWDRGIPREGVKS